MMKFSLLVLETDDILDKYHSTCIAGICHIETINNSASLFAIGWSIGDYYGDFYIDILYWRYWRTFINKY